MNPWHYPIAQNPTEIAIHYRLWAAELIVDHKIEFYPIIIKSVLNSYRFECMNRLLNFVEKIPEAPIKDLVIKVICQNWPLVKQEQLQEHLIAFGRLYHLASDDTVRAELIMAIVTRTELHPDFRKAVVEENEKDPEQRECLVKVIEEKREASLNGPQTKRAR